MYNKISLNKKIAHVSKNYLLFIFKYRHDDFNKYRYNKNEYKLQ